MVTRPPRREVENRALRALLNVLPPAARLGGSSEPNVIINGQSLELKWIGDGRLGDVKTMLSIPGRRPDVVAGRRLSAGARLMLTEASIGWVDETGAAEIATDSMIVSRSGRTPGPPPRSDRWTNSTLAVAEALLVGTPGTVSEAAQAAGVSAGSSANALRFLADAGLLEADAARGRSSARRMADPGRLLEAYATAAAAMPAQLSLQVGVVWQDHLSGLVEKGREWNAGRASWAATGLAAASVIAPYITTVSSSEVYVDARTISGLEAFARESGLRPIEGGRLTLRPFPTSTVRLLASEIAGLRVAPWPRVFADLRQIGVRGEEAAEHLREVMLES